MGGDWVNNDRDDDEGTLVTETAGVSVGERTEYAAGARVTPPPSTTKPTRKSAVAGPERPPPLEEYLTFRAPPELMCPLMCSVLDYPVVLAGDGFSYSRAVIKQHLASCRDHA